VCQDLVHNAFCTPEGNECECKTAPFTNRRLEESAEASLLDGIQYWESCPQGTYRLRGDMYSQTDGPICATILDHCPDGSYQLTAPSGTRNRECHAFTRCTADQFSGWLRPWSKYNDRTCTAYTKCDDSTQYVSQHPTSTRDRGCTVLTPCDVNTEYESNYGSRAADQDRQCAPFTPCTDSEFQISARWSPVVTYGNRATGPKCKAHRVCDTTRVSTGNWWRTSGCETSRPREYEAKAGSPTANRKCHKTKRCSKHEYMVTAWTATSDAVCKKHTACNPQGRSYKTHKADTKPTPCRDRTCVLKAPALVYPTCTVHEGSIHAMCNGAPVSVKAWGIGYQGEAKALGNCNWAAKTGKKWGVCPTLVYPTCTVHEGSIHAMCNGAPVSVKAWGIDSQGEAKALGNCNWAAKTGKKWGVCPAGQPRPSTCPAGQAFSAGSATADRTCTACTSGYIASAGTATSCTAWSTTCPAGQAFSVPAAPPPIAPVPRARPATLPALGPPRRAPPGPPALRARA
jgi:hypothetical protein